MRANVFTSPALTKQAGRFVWLSVDTEKSKNAAFLAKHPVSAWPTFLIVDQTTEQITLRWYGSATVAQLLQMMETPGSASTADAILARADRVNGERKWADAVVQYQQALAAGGPGWERRTRVIESLLRAMQFARMRQECADTALSEAPKLPRGASFANVVSTGLICTLGAAADSSWRAAALSRLKPLAEEAVGLPGLPSDDRSGIYDHLVSLALAEGNKARAQQIAREWFDFLEAERKRATTTEERSAGDGLRVSAALAMGDPARAVPALKASETALPDDYNPPARLAVLYREMGKLDDALAASDRAMAKAYGPRKIGILTNRAQIFELRGDRAGARGAIQEALTLAESLPDQQANLDRLRPWLARLR